MCSAMEVKLIGSYFKLVVELYQKNAGAQTTTPGLSLVRKLRYEHIYSTSFSKMQVDLAVQVCYVHVYGISLIVLLVFRF